MSYLIAFVTWLQKLSILSSIFSPSLAPNERQAIITTNDAPLNLNNLIRKTK